MYGFISARASISVCMWVRSYVSRNVIYVYDALSKGLPSAIYIDRVVHRGTNSEFEWSVLFTDEGSLKQVRFERTISLHKYVGKHRNQLQKTRPCVCVWVCVCVCVCVCVRLINLSITACHPQSNNTFLMYSIGSIHTPRPTISANLNEATSLSGILLKRILWSCHHFLFSNPAVTSGKVKWKRDGMC